MTSDSSDADEAARTESSDTHRQDRAFAGNKRLVVAIALSVLSVSTASLVFSLYTGSALNALVRENARLVRASSTPLLTFTTGNISDDGVARISFAVSNSGTGPARIVWFQIRNNGAAYANLQALAQSSGTPLPPTNILTRPLVQTLLRPGEDRSIIEWNRPASTGPELAAWQAVERARFNYQVEACYCSLLGDCWESTLNADDPRPVAECRAADRPSFGDIPLMLRTAGQGSSG